MLHYDSFHRRDTLIQDDSVQDPIGIQRVPILSLIYYILSEQLQTMLFERLLSLSVQIPYVEFSPLYKLCTRSPFCICINIKAEVAWT